MFFWRADGEGNEEAEDNMEDVRIPGTLAVRGTGHTQHPLRSARRRVQEDKNLDQMGTLITGLNSIAVVRALPLPFPLFPIHPEPWLRAGHGPAVGRAGRPDQDG